MMERLLELWAEGPRGTSAEEPGPEAETELQFVFDAASCGVGIPVNASRAENCTRTPHVVNSYGK